MEPEEVELLAQGQVEKSQDLGKSPPVSSGQAAPLRRERLQSYRQEGDVAEGRGGGPEDGEPLVHPLPRAVVQAPVENHQRLRTQDLARPPRDATHQLNSLKSFCATNQK